MVSHTSFKDVNRISVHGNPDDILMRIGKACRTKCRSDGKQATTAKLSQAKILTGKLDLRFAQVEFPSLLAIPTFDRISGLCNRRLNPKWGICLC